MADSTLTLEEVFAYPDARAVATDPQGRVYVVIAGESRVVRLGTVRYASEEYGGTGTGSYSLLEPSDVDPTNGLALWIADTGNGRLQHYSHDGQLLETRSVPLGDGDIEQANPPRSATTEVEPGQRGRPVAVAVGPAQTLYAVEAERGVVIKWDGQRLVQRLGASGDGLLSAPRDVVVADDGTVFVADPGQNAVLVFDALGSFRRAIPAPGVQALALAASSAGQRLLVIQPEGIAVHRVQGGLVERLGTALGEPLVGAAVAGETVWILTASHLYRAQP